MPMSVRAIEEPQAAGRAAICRSSPPGAPRWGSPWETPLAGDPVVNEVVDLERVAVLVEDDLLRLCADPAIHVALFVHGIVGGVRLRVDVPQNVPTVSWRARLPADAAAGERLTAQMIPAEARQVANFFIFSRLVGRADGTSRCQKPLEPNIRNLANFEVATGTETARHFTK
jgi:hypothetical protein